MEAVVTSSEMQYCDRYAIDTLKISGSILMENAGRGVVEMMEKHFGHMRSKTALIISGKGNNGGDGFVVARHLFNHGADVTVCLLGNESDLKGDTKLNFEIIKGINNIKKGGRLKIHRVHSVKQLRMLPKTAFIVDAVFGTGFSGEVNGFYSSVIDWINKSNGHVVSVDIPSGLDPDSGEVSKAVKADLTVTMSYKKIGLIAGEGKRYSGLIEVVDISIPPGIDPSVNTFIVGKTDIRLPERPFDAHKHSVGKVFILAGSTGYTGAAAMTASASMKSGAGAVILGVPKKVYPIAAKKLTEVMVMPLPDTDEGTVSLEAYGDIREKMDWADIVICGPGLSRNQETSKLVWKIVSECSRPLVLDADGLNNISDKISLLKSHRSREIIITPHTGELSRLTGLAPSEIEKGRVSVARQVSKQFKLTVVLKGAPTVTADEDQNVYVNPTGNPGMASAGMGDILSGLIGGLWAQGMKRTEAAYAGVFLHGLAGDMAKDHLGEKSLMATDLLKFIPDAFLEIEQTNLL